MQPWLNMAMVIGLHLVLIYGALSLPLKSDQLELPPSIAVRLLPLAEESRPAPPAPSAAPVPPKPHRETQHTPAPPPHPILAAKTPAQPQDFVSSAVPLVKPSQPEPTQAMPASPKVAAPALPAAPGPLIAPRFDADYLHNPKPVYPTFSRRNGEEGKVMLKVRVSPQGAALEVSIAKSSDYPRLDLAAQEAVSRWRFVPARRGDEAIESSVIVPITFTLD